jgi:glycine cleavage system H protein
MIPITLPITLMIFLFLILIGFSLLMFGGSEYLAGFIRSKLASSSVRRASMGSFEESLTAQSDAPGPPRRVEGYLLPAFLRYHPGHMWVAMKETGEAIIGLDDFAGKLIGGAKVIASPRIGQRFLQNEQGWILRRKGKDLSVLLPIDGEVVEINQRVFENPDLLAKDSYGGGRPKAGKPQGKSCEPSQRQGSGTMAGAFGCGSARHL